MSDSTVSTRSWDAGRDVASSGIGQATADTYHERWPAERMQGVVHLQITFVPAGRARRRGTADSQESERPH